MERLPLVRNILLVDDQSFVGMALSRLLAAEADLKVHTCLDADAALDRANELRPDLILQDLVMPKVDGLTLVRLFRGNPATAKTPILVLSANDDQESRQRALAYGANDYLVKLPPQPELIRCLRRHLAGDVVATPAGREVRHNVPVDRSVLPEGFAGSLIGRFVHEMNVQFAALEQAAMREDVVAMRAVAHKLKGVAGTVGARPLAATCGQLEDHLDRLGSSPQTLLAAVTEEVHRLREMFARQQERVG
jgi:CheY-like chemotaxis protein